MGCIWIWVNYQWSTHTMRCNPIIDTGTNQIVSATSQHMLKVSVRYADYETRCFDAVRFDAVKFDVSRVLISSDWPVRKRVQRVAVVRYMYILCSVWFVLTMKTFIWSVTYMRGFIVVVSFVVMPLSSMFFFCHCDAVVWWPQYRLLILPTFDW